MNKDEELAEYCKRAINKAVDDAGGVYKFVNQFIVVPNEESTYRIFDDALNSIIDIEALLCCDAFSLEVRKIKIEENGKLRINLFVASRDYEKYGEILYANQQCRVIWEGDKKSVDSSISFYHFPTSAVGSGSAEVEKKLIRT